MKVFLLKTLCVCVCMRCVQMVSGLFRKVQEHYIHQKQMRPRGRGNRHQASTVAAHFQQSLTELVTRLDRSPKSHHHYTSVLYFTD